MRYPVMTVSVTRDAGAPNSRLSAGSATATIVELSGVSAEPSAADTSTRVFAPASSGVERWSLADADWFAITRSTS